ncbi:hypothetical protein BDQ12DRAFT_670847 [Crucibulum laeve]|uniref:Uncharacterized protein n=1 Tax=Crucibulum laeve TaxID=68775 RepID=A0A5C3LJ82_9AGAR|nr:hypothetical protein BDQ12DRAFT_670847 [Crucibulum laeve]
MPFILEICTIGRAVLTVEPEPLVNQYSDVEFLKTPTKPPRSTGKASTCHSTIKSATPKNLSPDKVMTDSNSNHQFVALDANDNPKSKKSKTAEAGETSSNTAVIQSSIKPHSIKKKPIPVQITNNESEVEEQTQTLPLTYVLHLLVKESNLKQEFNDQYKLDVDQDSLGTLISWNGTTVQSTTRFSGWGEHNLNMELQPTLDMLNFTHSGRLTNLVKFASDWHLGLFLEPIQNFLMTRARSMFNKITSPMMPKKAVLLSKFSSRFQKAVCDVSEEIPVFDRWKTNVQWSYYEDLDCLEQKLPSFDEEIPVGLFAVVAHTISYYKKNSKWNIADKH